MLNNLQTINMRLYFNLFRPHSIYLKYLIDDFIYLRYLKRQCFFSAIEKERIFHSGGPITQLLVLQYFAIHLLVFEHDGKSFKIVLTALLINTRRYERRPDGGKNEINEPRVICDRKFSKKYIED